MARASFPRWERDGSWHHRRALASAHHELVLEDHFISLGRYQSGDAALARGGVAHRVEDGVGFVERLAREEHLRDQAREPYAAPYREMHVRRAPPAARIGHRV